jgi:hypothetical protein
MKTNINVRMECFGATECNDNRNRIVCIPEGTKEENLGDLEEFCTVRTISKGNYMVSIDDRRQFIRENLDKIQQQIKECNPSPLEKNLGWIPEQNLLYNY